jgi:iron complex transport system substrate-binding protein
MDGLYLLGFGPRTAAAARDLALSLYPDLAQKAATWKPAALSVDCHK